jgi:AcrR family transcriptional regulator
VARDGSSTRASILTAAQAEFSAHGLAGARVDRIAAAAGCSKERLYASFGDKEQLYRRVMRDMLEEMRLATIVRSDADIEDYVGKAYDFHREHPHLLRMLLWEALEGTGGALLDEQARRDCYQLSAGALAPYVDGDDATAKQLLLMLVGLTAWPHAVPALASIVTGGDSDTQTGQRRLRDFASSFAQAAINGLKIREVPRERGSAGGQASHGGTSRRRRAPVDALPGSRPQTRVAASDTATG